MHNDLPTTYGDPLEEQRGLSKSLQPRGYVVHLYKIWRAA